MLQHQKNKVILLKITTVILILLLIGCVNDTLKTKNLFFPIVIADKFGAINLKGEIVIPIQYRWLYFNKLGNERLVVEKEDYKAVIDYENEIVVDSIPYKYDVVICEDFIACTSRDLTDTLYYNLEGKSINLSERKYPTTIYKNLEISTSKCNSEIIDTSRNSFLVTSCFLDCGIALAFTDTQWGYIDKNKSFIWSHDVAGMKDYIRFQDRSKKKIQDEKSFQSLKQTRRLMEVYIARLFVDINGKRRNRQNFRHSKDQTMWIIL